MEVDKEAVQNFRSGFRALTPDHCRLLDVCMGRSKTDPVNEALSDDALMWKDMRNLRNMVQVELFESMKVAMDGTEDSSEKAEPHVFDIFLMQTTFRQVTNNRRHRHLALCIPVNRNEFAWYDGEVTIYSSKEVSPKWRVTSLSGAARTLLALSESHDLKGMAMARQGLVDAVELGEDEEDAFPDITSNMNESQRRAVATVVSPCFQKGFFAIQGPPGCGSR